MMSWRPGRSDPAVVTLIVALAACSAASPATTPGDGARSAAPGESAGASAPPDTAGGPEGYEGSLVTSGLYDATWTVSPDQQADALNVGPTLTSDRGTFGNITVQLDGSLSFGSGAPELSSHGLQYSGTASQVRLDETGGFVCAFTVDTDLAAADGTTLHIAGGLTVHWHPEGLGGLDCP